MDLLQELTERGIMIQVVDEGHLALTPKDRVSPEMVERVKARKHDLLRALRAAQDRGGRENVVPGPELRTITVFSKVLKREVFISWQDDNPESVIFDGVPYTLAEIARLKEMPLAADDLRTINRVKREFEGEIR